MGTKASNSAVATVVERMTGYLTLVHLPDGHTSDAVADALIARLAAMPSWFARTLTWDRGVEMARHARITEQTKVRSTSPTPTPPGSAAATRTPTACSASTSPRAPTCPPSPPNSSSSSQTSSTTAPAPATATTPPAKCSLNSSTDKNHALRRPPETAMTRLRKDKGRDRQGLIEGKCTG